MKTQPATLSLAASQSRQAGKLDARLGACLAFGAAAFVSIIATATATATATAAVASHEFPLLLGGF